MDYKDSTYTRHKRIRTYSPPYRTARDDDRLTLRRVANGCCFAASLILLYVFLAPLF